MACLVSSSFEVFVGGVAWASAYRAPRVGTFTDARLNSIDVLGKDVQLLIVWVRSLIR